MAEDKPEYQSYLLRVWQVREEERWAWRASLQPIPIGPAHGFAELRDLFAYLEAQTRRPGIASPSNDGE